jgi:hypothetical protein
MQNGPELVKEYVSAKRRIISESVATRTLNENESGAAVLFDRAAGTVYTLPAACAPGTFFDFYVSVTATSNAHKIITGAGTELMVGQILNCDTDTSDAVAIWKGLVGSSYIAVSMNGSTKGGIKGDVIRVTKLNATSWGVHGQINSTGTVATPFATS